MYIFIAIAAGLGLFLVGAKLIGGNLRRLGSRRFRAGVGRAAKVPPAIAGVGIIIGALMLTTATVTFVCINAVGAGVVKARQVLPLLTWANLGTAALVVIATLDVHVLVVLLLGAVGVFYYFELDRHVRLRHLVGALLGAGLLFFGIDLLREGAEGLRNLPGVPAAVAYAQQDTALAFVALAFVLGLLAAVLARSSAMVTIAAMVLAGAGLLGVEQGIAVVYGAGIGSALALWYTAQRLGGTPRQLAGFQVFTKLSAAVVLVPLFAIELLAHVPLLEALLATMTTGAPAQLAGTYVAYQLVAIVIASLLREPAYGWLQRRYPETADENLAKPRFIYVSEDTEAQTGVLLVEREQQRLLGFLRESLDWIREDAEAPAEGRAEPLVLRQAAESVGGEVVSFIGELLDSSPQRETVERLVTLRNGQSFLDQLAEEVFGLVARVRATTMGATLAPAVGSMVESLYLVLAMLGDELESPDEFQRSSLGTMTADRSKMVDQLRRDLTRAALSKAEQETLLNVTTSFERSMRLVQRYLALTAPNVVA